MSPVGGTARYVWYVECGCPPYTTIVAGEVSSEARRQRDRRGRVESDGVNPLADFTDNMWCRRGSQVTPGDPDVRAVRVDGT